MSVKILENVTLETLQDKATRLRIDSVRSTTEAGSGHPTSCCSAAEIMSVLFYSVMRYVDQRYRKTRCSAYCAPNGEWPVDRC
jgi:transketolase N-terminal domain/subunit